MTVQPPLPDDNTPHPSILQTNAQGHNINTSGHDNQTAARDINTYHITQIIQPTPKLAKSQEASALRLAKAEPDALKQLSSGTNHLIHQLPRRYDDTTRFYGRTTEQANIHTFVETHERLITIYGRAGVGKTGLASKVLSDLIENTDQVGGLVALTAGATHHQASLDRILSDFKRLLPEDSLTYQASDSAYDKVVSLLYSLQGGHYVLLLDNFESLLDENDALSDAELQTLFTGVLERGGLTIIITTRYRPRLDGLLRPYERPVPLDSGLSPEDALLMLRGLDKSGRLPAEDTQLYELIQRVEGFPRALEAVLGLLVDSPTLTLEELLQDDTLFTGEVTGHIVEKALSILPPLYIRVMEGLALFDQPVTLAAMQYLLAPYAVWSKIKLRTVLDRLIERHFVSYDSVTQYYSLHPLDRTYCNARIPHGTPEDVSHSDPRVGFKVSSGKSVPPRYVPGSIPPFNRYALNARAAHFFRLQRNSQSQWKVLADLDPHLSEFQYLIRMGDYDAATEMLIEFDFRLLIWGYPGLVKSLHEQLIGNVKDLPLRAMNLGSLGLAHSALGDVHQGITYYHQALPIARTIGDKRIEEIILDNLGTGYSKLGEIHEATTFYEQSLAISREIKRQEGEATHLGNLGNIYRDLDDLDKAKVYYEQALGLSQKMGNKYGQGNHLGNLGNVYRVLGDWGKAAIYYEQALILDREVGNKSGEAGILGNIGTLYHNLGDLSKAAIYCEQALALSREIRDKYTERIRLGNLGSIYRDLGDWGKAAIYYERALALSRGMHNKKDECEDLESLGSILVDQEDYIAGFAHLNEALQIAASVRVPRSQYYVDVNIARAYLLKGDLSYAQPAVEAAYQHKILGDNHTVAMLYGLILLRVGKTTAAQMMFYEAISFADTLLKQPQSAYNVRYTQALAQAGLALINNASVDVVQADYETALTQCAATGVVQRNLRLLKQLALTQDGERLEPLLALLRERL